MLRVNLVNGMQTDNLLDWLLEEDKENPGVRYYALTSLLECSEDDPDVVAAQGEVMASGPVPVILAAQHPEGYWVEPGSGYRPKYRGTVWQVIFLAELGADSNTEGVRRACEYLLEHSIARNEAFSVYPNVSPRGALHCLNGNLLAALVRLGWVSDRRVQAALNWQAAAITGHGEVEYYKSGTAAPGFACGVNQGQPCGWGANKAMRALLSLPGHLHTPEIQAAIESGAEFLLSRDPAVADYPYTEKVSSIWFKLGFPLSYWSDVLETTAVLVEAGRGSDPHLANAFELILSKRDKHGRWKLENSLNGKMWIDIERRGKPSKWVTLRALRVLKQAGKYAVN